MYPLRVGQNMPCPSTKTAVTTSCRPPSVRKSCNGARSAPTDPCRSPAPKVACSTSHAGSLPPVGRCLRTRARRRALELFHLVIGGNDGAPDCLPVLDAGPVKLRGFLARDLAMVEEASTDPLIPLVSTVPVPGSARSAAEYIERQQHRLRDRYGYSFVIAQEAGPGDREAGPSDREAGPSDREAGPSDRDRAVGSIGLWLRDIDEGRATVGYWVVPSARGHHFAAHALVTIGAWAFATLHVPRLQLHVEPWNMASVRTAESAGYTCEGLLRSWQEVGERRRDMYVYSLLPDDRLRAPTAEPSPSGSFDA